MNRMSAGKQKKWSGVVMVLVLVQHRDGNDSFGPGKEWHILDVRGEMVDGMVKIRVLARRSIGLDQFLDPIGGYWLVYDIWS